MENRKPADLARALYAALATGDRDQLDALLHPEFSGRTAEGMPWSARRTRRDAQQRLGSDRPAF